jgi:hypothetical protein
VRDTWRFLYRTKLEPRHWHVLEQDREMLDGVGLGSNGTRCSTSTTPV